MKTHFPSSFLSWNNQGRFPKRMCASQKQKICFIIQCISYQLFRGENNKHSYVLEVNYVLSGKPGLKK